jgi:hypothetical protein
LEYGLLWERFLGFDDKRFVLAGDFGFKTKAEMESLVVESDIDEEREVEGDPGGVDRY